MPQSAAAAAAMTASAAATEMRMTTTKIARRYVVVRARTHAVVTRVTQMLPTEPTDQPDRRVDVHNSAALLQPSLRLIMPRPRRVGHNALMDCLSVRPSVCPVPTISRV